MKQLTRFQQKLIKRKNVILASDDANFNTQEIEQRIACSTAEDCLRQVKIVGISILIFCFQQEVVFALHVANICYQHPSLVILVQSCYFPGYDEQPESVIL